MENSRYKFLLIIALAIVSIIFITIASAETTYTSVSCEIKITIKMALSGVDNVTAQKWVNDITSTWNGYTYGDCKCPVKVEVDLKLIQGLCEQNPQPGYHCIDVTIDYARDTAGKIYRGYMKGVSEKGKSLLGWWSLHMNEPLPGIQGTIHDAAHEAGHMLGLEDDYNTSSGVYGESIMGRTWGDKAKPTQDQINQIVEKNYGSNTCPKPQCCCGNNKIDEGEECDHSVKPNGCSAGALCVSCKCFVIIPQKCGDGKVNGDEECDYMSKNKTCPIDKECNNNCKCVKKEDGNEFKIVITTPNDGDTIDDVTSVKVNITNNESKIEKVKFYMNGSSVYTDTEAPWKWTLDPTKFNEGRYILKVKAYDKEGNTAEDEIKIEIER